jgi:hypothetical protein
MERNDTGCCRSMAVAGQRSVRSENMAVSRSSDGGSMQVCRIVVRSSCVAYWSRDSEPSGASRPGEVSSDESLS